MLWLLCLVGWLLVDLIGGLCLFNCVFCVFGMLLLLWVRVVSVDLRGYFVLEVVLVLYLLLWLFALTWILLF